MEIGGVEYQLKRIADALEAILAYNKPALVPGRDFDSDDFSEVTYSNEQDELIQQHMANRIGGVVVNDLGL